MTVPYRDGEWPEPGELAWIPGTAASWQTTPDGLPPLPDGWLAVSSLPRVESVMQQRHWPYDARVTVNVHYTLHPPAGLCVASDRCWCRAGHLPPHCEKPEPPSMARYFLPPRWLLNLTWLAVVAVMILLAVRLS